MRIDRAHVQILFADAQTALVANSRTGSLADIDRASGVLAQCAAVLGVPMTFSAVYADDAPPVMLDALRTFADNAHVFVRASASPFMDAACSAALKAHRRMTLVIAGHAAEVAVVHAALEAIAQGYRVYLPLDAIGGLDPRTEMAVIRHLELAGATVGSVATLVSMMAPDFADAPGTHIVAAVRELTP